MGLDERKIRLVLEHFNVGDYRSARPIESGFQSDNYYVQTNLGDYVVRIVHESVERIEFAMRVHEYLADNDIKTPRPMRTNLGTFIHHYNNQHFVVQSFIQGADVYEPLEAVDPLLPFYGNKLGQIHKVLLGLTDELGEDVLDRGGVPFSWVRDSSKKYMPDDDFVKEQYSLWLKEIDQIFNAQLTQGITHGDIGPKDFFFDNGEFTGVMDFNSAGYSFLLMDVVSMIMYGQLMRANRTEQYRIFMKSYLKIAPIHMDEINWLHLLLRTRWFVQIFYHQYRYVEGITQGLDADETKENLVGVTDGIEFLRITDEYPRDHFYRLLSQ